MAYHPTIPASYTTNRQQLYAGIEALVDAFITSESYAVGRAYRSVLPDKLTGESPLIVMGDVSEQIVHDMQTRRTVYSGSIWYLDWLTVRAEYIERVNRWADRMRDLFTYNSRTLMADEGGGELVQTGFEPGELRQGQIVMGAPLITFEWRVLGGYQ